MKMTKIEYRIGDTIIFLKQPLSSEFITLGKEYEIVDLNAWQLPIVKSDHGVKVGIKPGEADIVERVKINKTELELAHDEINKLREALHEIAYKTFKKTNSGYPGIIARMQNVARKGLDEF